MTVWSTHQGLAVVSLDARDLVPLAQGVLPLALSSHLVPFGMG
jgi:hypothetical protein